MDDSFEGFESSDADWQAAYRAILDACLPDPLAVEESAATVPRTNAVAALADADDSSAEPIAALTREQAEALLASLDAGSVVDCTGDAVGVLFDPADDRPRADQRWDVATDALADELERLVSEANAQRAGETDREIEAELEAIAEEIRDLGSGEGTPDPDALGDDESERFRELREEFTYYKQLQEANSDPPLALGDSVARLPLNLPAGATDPLAAFGELVEAAAGLRDAVERGEIEGIDECLSRLADLLDDRAE
ncbi:hypothetical protein [Halorussus halobius]|uniref:hypothetical protein n=1 Tax=Halorussus halobius TaxID=1710537 RepID=UPI001091D610|nr:hypothetical protein [Halorussus halobius]